MSIYFLCNFSRTYNTWSGKVHLPIGKEILYRYFVAYILEPDNEYVKQKHVFVHSWESHYKSRIVSSTDGILIVLENTITY